MGIIKQAQEKVKKALEVKPLKEYREECLTAWYECRKAGNYKDVPNESAEYNFGIQAQQIADEFLTRALNEEVKRFGPSRPYREEYNEAEYLFGVATAGYKVAKRYFKALDERREGSKAEQQKATSADS